VVQSPARHRYPDDEPQENPDQTGGFDTSTGSPLLYDTKDISLASVKTSSMDFEPTRRGALAGIGAIIAGTSLAGCSGDGDGGDGGDNGDNQLTVDMTDDLVFDPEEITISVGETVTWDNVGTIGHSVTAYEDEIPGGAEYFASGGFDSQQAAEDAYAPGDTDSGNIPGGETYEHTFETAGTYEYFCIPHEDPGMVGTVVVEE